MTTKGPLRADFRPKRADLWPEGVVFRPERADFRSEKARGGQTDRWTNRSPKGNMWSAIHVALL